MASTKASLLALAAVLLAADNALTAQQSGTTEAFNGYVRQAEVRIGSDRSCPGSFLKFESRLGVETEKIAARLRRGEIVIEKYGDTPQQVPGGLIHDWVGTVFIPDSTVRQVIELVRDYDHLATYYSPDVMQSRLISGAAGDLHAFMRLRKHRVITIVLDTEFDVHYRRIDNAHQFSVSRSTKVSEIADPGTGNERVLPAGHDHGFLWRLNTYWAFEQVKDGVFVECEAISLTRDIPTGLAWMIGPFVDSIPRESLQSTLSATRAAVTGRTFITRKQEGDSF